MLLHRRNRKVVVDVRRTRRLLVLVGHATGVAVLLRLQRLQERRLLVLSIISRSLFIHHFRLNLLLQLRDFGFRHELVVGLRKLHRLQLRHRVIGKLRMFLLEDLFQERLVLGLLLFLGFRVRDGLHDRANDLRVVAATNRPVVFASLLHDEVRNVVRRHILRSVSVFFQILPDELVSRGKRSPLALLFPATRSRVVRVVSLRKPNTQSIPIEHREEGSDEHVAQNPRRLALLLVFLVAELHFRRHNADGAGLALLGAVVHFLHHVVLGLQIQLVRPSLVVLEDERQRLQVVETVAVVLDPHDADDVRQVLLRGGDQGGTRIDQSRAALFRAKPEFRAVRFHVHHVDGPPPVHRNRRPLHRTRLRQNLLQIDLPHGHVPRFFRVAAEVEAVLVVFDEFFVDHVVQDGAVEVGRAVEALHVQPQSQDAVHRAPQEREVRLAQRHAHALPRHHEISDFHPVHAPLRPHRARPVEQVLLRAGAGEGRALPRAELPVLLAALVRAQLPGDPQVVRPRIEHHGEVLRRRADRDVPVEQHVVLVHHLDLLRRHVLVLLLVRFIRSFRHSCTRLLLRRLHDGDRAALRGLGAVGIHGPQVHLGAQGVGRNDHIRERQNVHDRREQHAKRHHLQPPELEKNTRPRALLATGAASPVAVLVPLFRRSEVVDISEVEENKRHQQDQHKK
mmetsp:Transcript_18829/g.47080  ORF Transcript_18829/g.47080 Transcript_18829/m.47080 type:complete len:679 (+) Transcript_18829:874-2910(+)